jgi:GNAT superfamily N-acetyltransferase
VGFKREKGKKLRHKAIIWGMYVVPEVRRLGVGKALLKEMIGRAREMEGLEQLILTVCNSLPVLPPMGELFWLFNQLLCLQIIKMKLRYTRSPIENGGYA